ncbi:uncharacterized protein EV154DRAFT_397890, partial [Mucor mucedo]|uniref:uncharacterized protein n=1 Tax=Mucor mucedo TaxID=29922 RepID=UPI00221FACAA
ADLVGLKILAKAGYDPKIAVEVWEMMAALEEEIKEIENEETKDGTAKIESSAVIAARKSVATGEEEENQKGVELGAFLDSLVNSWFGSTHPPSLERIEYMRENMDEAILLYNEAIKLNGSPK